MTDDELGILREKVRRCCDGTSVAHAWLFGSRTRDDADVDSDMDILVEPLPNVRWTLLTLSALELSLRDALGMSVHLLTRGDLHESALAEVEMGKVLLYG